MVSGLDLFPTILEWFNVPYPDTSRLLTGQSLLPLTVDPRNSSLFDHVFASHNSDEVSPVHQYDLVLYQTLPGAVVMNRE